MKSGEICDIFTLFGVLAQLGACHTGSVEVTGSSPVYSMKDRLRVLKALGFFVVIDSGLC